MGYSQNTTGSIKGRNGSVRAGYQNARIEAVGFRTRRVALSRLALRTRPIGPSRCQVLGLIGPVVWAHSTPKFIVCERDKEGRRVLNATALNAAFLLPPRGSGCLHVRRVSRAGRPLDVSPRKPTLRGEGAAGFWVRLGVGERFWESSHREDCAWSGGNTGGLLFFMFFEEIKEEVLNLTAGAFFAGYPSAALDVMTQVMCRLDNLKLEQDMLLHQFEEYWEAMTDAARELYHGTDEVQQPQPAEVILI
ncbi:hypothetical protein Taro_023695 [Colocasia esculenta]|uniref:Uncharacterized protein n=1 Tax=Colocasia esculenta TaxID=4460 RepID=A0A843V4G0_COLES|nr:hypothetical protein [Colocasia esculenta]